MRRIKVLFNALVLNGSRSGYARVFPELLHALGEHYSSEIEIHVLVQRSGMEVLEPGSGLLSRINFIVIPDFPRKLIRGLFEQIVVPLMALAYRFDVVHMPSTFGLIFPTRPTVLWFHTATSFMMPSSLRGRGRTQAYLHNCLVTVTSQTASVVLLTTAKTKAELVSFVRSTPPCVVIGNGCTTRFTKALTPRRPSNLAPRVQERKYVLTVSQFYRLKNHDGVIRAFIAAKKRGFIDGDWCLVVCGTVQEIDYYKECVAEAAGRGDVCFVRDIEDQEIAWLYRNAGVYCFLSQFEGFGMTPLEALQFDIPVVLSDIPVLREVYGQGFLYVDPLDADQAAEALGSALTDNYRSYCTRNRVLRRYSWESIASVHMDAYSALAEGGNAIL